MWEHLYHTVGRGICPLWQQHALPNHCKALPSVLKAGERKIQFTCQMGSWKGSLNILGVNVSSNQSENPLGPFISLHFAFPGEGRGNVSATASMVWVFGVVLVWCWLGFFFVNYVILKHLDL